MGILGAIKGLVATRLVPVCGAEPQQGCRLIISDLIIDNRGRT